MKKLVLGLIVSTIVALIGYFLFCPFIKLTNKAITLSLGDTYSEYGYKAGNMFQDLTNKVVVSGEIDTNKIGTYEVNYTLNYLFYEARATREVTIIDETSPMIELEGDEEVNVCPHKTYEEEGYKASDNYDGDLTDKVEVDVDKEKITYRVFDSSNNKDEKIRTLIYQDVNSPIINLNGEDSMTIYIGYSYNEPGYEVSDNCDEEIEVTIEGYVDTNTIGSYTLTYTAVDSSGNEVSVNRKVNVISKPSYYGNGKIYLTFDDGPSANITPGILDILKDEGVHATFFILNKSDSLNYLIKRAYDEGHTIALHGATHEYSYIYSSGNNFFSDLNIISNKVKNIIGVESKIIRFPGGSSNTISRHYSYGIMSYLTSEVLALGYHYFDWNVDSNDAGGASSSKAIYYNVVNNLSHSKTNVVLMHDSDTKYYTLYALRDIIRYGKDNGYTFDAITMDTLQVHHGVNN